MKSRLFIHVAQRVSGDGGDLRFGASGNGEPRDAAAGTAATAPPQQSLAQALTEAFGHRSYWLLVLGFFTCGFQIFFIAVHLPAYLVDRGLPAEIGGWTLGVVGLFNIVGAIAAGWLSPFMPKRYRPSLLHL